MELKEILEMYTSFGIEQDYDKLLDKILMSAMDYTNCDAGTLYICEKEKLHFKIVITKSRGVHLNLNVETEINGNYPPVEMDPKFACAYCAFVKRPVNIDDVYHETKYDFSGPRKYDEMTGYKTKTMLIVPMENHFGEVIGVIQLINAKEKDDIIPFGTHYHNILESFGVQAGICLNNMAYAKENLEQIHSFVDVLATAIDELSKFNSNHSNNMLRFAENYLDWLEEQKGPIRISPQDRNQLLMSIRLHDIGKLTTPQNVLNKITRLDMKLETVVNRIEKLLLYSKVAYLDKKISYDTYYMNMLALEEAQRFIPEMDKAEFISDENIGKIKFLGSQKFIYQKGTETVLKEEELKAMLVQKGNLTPEERKMIQNHVSVTEKMLSKIKFTKDFKDVPFWASAHHELLNGKGYPHQLTADEIPLPVRILTVLDVFEALVSLDRPYKQPKTPEEAANILDYMIKDGEVDAVVVETFLASKAWEK